jgi:hypothetical protein
MSSELEAQRRAFEADYPHEQSYWMAKNPDGTYRNAEIQDAWLQFLKGWKSSQGWVSGLAVADTSFIPKD